MPSFESDGKIPAGKFFLSFLNITLGFVNRGNTYLKLVTFSDVINKQVDFFEKVRFVNVAQIF